MKRSLAAALGIGIGGVLGLAVKKLQWSSPSPGAIAMRRLTSYFIVPVWVGAGFLDYLWHRHTKIETTSGLEESLVHTAMMVEATPAVLAPLFLEVNAGLLAWMISLSLIHELTVLYDLWYTTPRRAIPAGEQVTHTFLEAPPFLVTAAAISTHWDQFRALLGRGPEQPRFDIRLQSPAIPLRDLLLMFAALGLFGGLPHVDELRRCIQAKRQGRTGEDTRDCVPEVFS